jgi:hypothetical protein
MIQRDCTYNTGKSLSNRTTYEVDGSAVARWYHNFNNGAYVFPCICHPRQPCSLTVSPGDDGPPTRPCPNQARKDVWYALGRGDGGDPRKAHRSASGGAEGCRRRRRGRVGSKSRGRVDDARIVYRTDRSSSGSLRALVNARNVVALRNQKLQTEIACDEQEQSCYVVV